MLFVLPASMALANVGNIYSGSVSGTSSSSLTVAFKGGFSARTFEYQLSTTSGVAGFGAWSALASTKIIGSLAASTQYWVRLRSVRGMVKGPVSASFTGTTDAAAGGGEVFFGWLFWTTKAS